MSIVQVHSLLTRGNMFLSCVTYVRLRESQLPKTKPTVLLVIFGINEIQISWEFLVKSP